MEKETKSNETKNSLLIEKKIDELGASIINIKIKKSRHNKIINNQEKQKNENEKNNENKIEKKDIDLNNNKEDFNLEDFNNFVKQNVNVQIAPNNSNQLKSHHKPHLKLNLGMKKKIMNKI